ncbi:pro-opiomelanocortin [Dromiciops gliroides]|uniref:pro-opiomelanocortin n=1 Tax=Dromiciops gliroides TaxID=33562 RepID=UPI001CC682C9|nr:pro-opiomelanocortin [Dromiciops gliroides]
MPKPSWSCLGALLVALLFQASVEVNGQCSEEGQWDVAMIKSALMQCIDSLDVNSSPGVLEFKGAGQGKANLALKSSWNKSKQRKGRSVSVSSDGENEDQKRQELVAEDFLDLLSPTVWEEDKEMQGEGLPLLRTARQSDHKRSYSMEHFRWGKPVGKKRRPVKVQPNGVEEHSTESNSANFKRDLHRKLNYAEVSELDDGEGGDAMEPNRDKVKKDKEPYRMQHFRWGPPPSTRNKRYGGFMVSEKSHTPLMTLFKNAIIKSAHEKGQ